MKEDKPYLLHMRDAVRKIQKFTKDVAYTGFLKNELVQSAVIREIEVIGEAASQLSPAIKEKHASVPWVDIVGMRHKLIHGYFGVDLEIVWQAVQKDIPALKASIAQMLKETDAKGKPKGKKK